LINCGGKLLDGEKLAEYGVEKKRLVGYYGHQVKDGLRVKLSKKRGESVRMLINSFRRST